ncbi:MAG: hypothetical protein V8T62_02590 [Oscillospiraceae bacterium]
MPTCRRCGRWEETSWRCGMTFLFECGFPLFGDIFYRSAKEPEDEDDYLGGCSEGGR